MILTLILKHFNYKKDFRNSKDNIFKNIEFKYFKYNTNIIELEFFYNNYIIFLMRKIKTTHLKSLLNS